MNHQIITGPQILDGDHMAIRKNDYTSKDIRVLNEIEQLQLNCGMYIGDTNNPVHLIEEVLDNALDEALAGYAKIIAVSINTKENIFAVLDNGRGIPISDNTPIIVSSKLYSGAKFQDKKTVYEICVGLHGIGLVAVNALSDYYKLEIYRDNKYAQYMFEDAKLKYSKITEHTGECPFSTKIEFKPSKKYFETLKPDISRIRQRLTTASAEMPNDISFVLQIDDKQEVFNLTMDRLFIQECFTETDTKKILVHTLSSVCKPESFKAFLAYEEEASVAPRIISSVNLLPVKEGGSHVIFLFDLLKEFFKNKAKKLGYAFQPNDCLYGLRAYISLKLVEPKFSSQTKDKLINRKDYFLKFEKDINNWLDQLPEETVKDYLDRFQEYRRKLDSKKLVVNGSGKRASTQFTKLRDCTSRNGILFVVEEESAGGSILSSRDTKYHAVLPLKGKSIPNITTKKDILKNKEVEELTRALGTGVGPHFDISKIRYSKIVCATDADHDGNHIACLLTMCVGILFPEIVKAGKYFIAQTPLFAINEGKVFIPLWNDQQLEKARQENRKIQRYKGLGEMNPSQLKICLLDEATRYFMPVTYSNNIDELIKLFSSAEEKRKLVVGD